jgi:N-acetylglucosaminyldiphosphoundecaprenol N-acetyl-beta-D-mannosaminyltransferase
MTSLQLDAPEPSATGLDAVGHVATCQASHSPLVSVLGVRINNLRETQAIAVLEQAILDRCSQTTAIYFVNAHTLNLAAENPDYRDLLNRGDYVFGDGTGVRWAARARSVRMLANLNGTDLVPRLFRDTAGRGYRYFLFGATSGTIARAAANVQHLFPGWTLAGFHHGYVSRQSTREVIRQISAAKPHLLLVGMGNPLQEQWIDRHRRELDVRLCMGTGGLFDHWAGNLRRAPRWVRALGCEWVQLLLQQPHKARRYLIGNPLFLWRMMALRARDIAAVTDNVTAGR